MGAILKLVLGFAGGPVGWAVTAWGWVCSAAAWCFQHWKLCLAVTVLLAAAYGGMRYERTGWETKWAARDAKDKADEEQRIRTNQQLQGEYERIDSQAQIDKAAREAAYATLSEKVKVYVEKQKKTALPPGCPVPGIGDDGLQLVRDAIRARHLPH